MQRLRLSGCLLVLFLLGTQGAAWADIPPPPPEVPGTELPLPSPVSTAVGGLLLSAAAVLVGMQLIRDKGQGSRKAVWVCGGLFLAATLALTTWSVISYKLYDQMRSNWRSPGPVEQYDFEDTIGPELESESLESAAP